MLKNSPVYIGCVITLKNAVDEMKSQNNTTYCLLQDILTKLGPAQPQNVPNPTTCQPLPSPAPPSDFSSDCADRKVFLTSCWTYIHLCPEVFDNKDTKIVWAISYIKSGYAGHWAAWEFEYELKNGTLCFIDWLDFEW